MKLGQAAGCSIVGREQAACPLLLSVQGGPVPPGRSLVTLPEQHTTMSFPRLAAQSVAHVVPLFLDGDVSFLPQNSFPCSFQPFGVCLIWAGAPERGCLHRLAARTVMTWTLFFPCRMGSTWRHRDAWSPSSWPSSAPCPVMYVDGGAGGRGALPKHPPASVHTKLHGQTEEAAAALGRNTFCVSSR